MRIWIALAVILSLSGCKRAPQETKSNLPVKGTAAGVGLIDFDWPEANFSCLAPADWKLEDAKYMDPKKGISFMGNNVPSQPITETSKLSHITVLKYPESGPDRKDAAKYADTFWEVTENNEQPALEKTKIGGNDVILFHYQKPYRKPHSKKVEYMLRLDYALISCKGGFYELWHSAPASSYQNTLPIFDAVVRSFKPKS